MTDHANTNHKKAVLAILISDNFKLTGITNDKQGHFQNKGVNQEDKIITGKNMLNWQHIKKQRHNFANKGLYTQSYGFSSNHVWVGP